MNYAIGPLCDDLFDRSVYDECSSCDKSLLQDVRLLMETLVNVTLPVPCSGD